MKTNVVRSLLAMMILALTVQLQGCAFAVGAVAGAATGYTLRGKGYEVRSPVVRDGR